MSKYYNYSIVSCKFTKNLPKYIIKILVAFKVGAISALILVRFFSQCTMSEKWQLGKIPMTDLKVSKSRKQIIMSLILPKKWMNHTQDSILSVFLSFFWKNRGLHDLLPRFTDLYIMSNRRWSFIKFCGLLRKYEL